MKKNNKRWVGFLMIFVFVLGCTMIFAAPPARPSGEMPNAPGGTPPARPSGEMPMQPEGTPPDKPNGNGGGPGENSNAADISHVGAIEISSDTIVEEKTYSSITDSQNALLVTGGTSTLTNPTITKSGDADDDSSDFYGTNAAVLVKEGTLNINGGTVITDGSHANGVFAYANGTIQISDTVIKTNSNNSGAIMVTGGGTLNANNVTAETEGNSSAPIRSDRGGGTLTVNGGSFTSHGMGSPAIYSTADIVANNAYLCSTTSEGVVVEGKNSITLNNTTLEASNTKLNGNSETYKAIFLYQSMSQDAEIGTAHFTAKDSKIVNQKGDLIFVTNTSAVVELENNEILNHDAEGAFLKIGAGKWGTTGSNGGNVTLTATNQKIEGNMIIDNISTLDVFLKDGSAYEGTINGENTAKEINVTLDSRATLSLTGDSYVTSLTNETADNSNIQLNGHTLYVNGIALTTNNQSETISQGESLLKILIPVIILIVVIWVIILIKKMKTR